jgi:hypothetical protein
MKADATTMLRDTLVTLTVLAIVAFAIGGVDWLVGALAGGALAALNVFLLGRLVGNLDPDNSGPLMLGLLLKSGIGLAVLFLLLKFLAPLGVMLGVAAGVVALTFRGAAGAFARPQET